MSGFDGQLQLIDSPDISELPDQWVVVKACATKSS